MRRGWHIIRYDLSNHLIKTKKLKANPERDYNNSNQEACKRGLESRLIPPFFTCIGKMKVLVQSKAALILSKAALLILIVMMMIAIVATLISLGFLAFLSLSAGLYFINTNIICLLEYIFDTTL